MAAADTLTWPAAEVEMVLVMMLMPDEEPLGDPGRAEMLEIILDAIVTIGDDVVAGDSGFC